MKFFLDSADLTEIRRAMDAGLIDGITTNPSLLAKVAGADHEPREVLAEICRIVPGPISAEVVATTRDEMLREGRELAKLADNIVVKVPLTEAGLMACRHFRAEDIRVNVTLCFSAAQALLAAKAGASYISPFVGRLDDIAQDGMQLIEQIVQMYGNYDFQTEVLVASVRHPVHVVQAALIGADVATVPAKVLHQLMQHPLTDKGLAGFLADWQKLPEAKRAI
ncbi:MAG TPA: fructose-6-phosphate aldolase [Longimicrobiales bacterium]|jgi:transaldolase|nr:fructose-6-phosphate aldolase [Longimicrobiales bacterium]HSK18997.1 fructose-6-phosphate aldolase [Longimicrobiales bacterium]